MAISAEVIIIEDELLDMSMAAVAVDMLLAIVMLIPAIDVAVAVAVLMVMPLISILQKVCSWIVDLVKYSKVVEGGIS